MPLPSCRTSRTALQSPCKTVLLERSQPLCQLLPFPSLARASYPQQREDPLQESLEVQEARSGLFSAFLTLRETRGMGAGKGKRLMLLLTMLMLMERARQVLDPLQLQTTSCTSRR
mmetsp:Transcript_44959/g.141534  ORF Transcript_44959/g.141534 Transcript_44959/m.141534 type:complete len:116 (-) Transcript_44959:215-562(-)